MDDCIFCKIARGEIPCAKVYEDENVLAFSDISPQAPVHTLVIPKTHYADLTDLAARGENDLGNLLRAASEVARLQGLTDNGFRVVNNSGRDGCQSVKHVHFHVLGGKQLSEKMS